MDIKKIPPVPVIFFTTRTTLNELSSLVGAVAAELYKEAAAQQLLPVGPITWIYIGADGKPDTVFTLEIALPVHGQPATESLFLYKELPAFQCATTVHYGAWNKLGDAYRRLFAGLQQNGRQANGFCREEYIRMDFADTANNITEVQVGI